MKNSLNILLLFIYCLISPTSISAVLTDETTAQKTLQASIAQAQELAVQEIKSADDALNKKMKVIENSFNDSIKPAQAKMEKETHQAYQTYADTLKSVKERFDKSKKLQQNKYDKTIQK